MKYMNISQGSNGGFSHSGTKAIDYLGWDKDGRVYQCPYYAPFDCTCTYKSSDGAGIGWTSDSEVNTPSGKKKLTVVFYHDNNLSEMSIGDKRKQGALIGHTGTAGHVTGDHAHIEVFLGNAYASPNIENWQAFYINGVTVINDWGYNWSKGSFTVDPNLQWIALVDTYLNESQMMNNAQLVLYHFAGTDWSKESLSAMVGNMSHESTLNPQLYEMGYGHDPSRGYGLVQWTPATKLWDWCTSNSLDWSNGDSQLARIDYEVEQNIQWIPRDSIDNMTFQEFRTNAKGWSVEQLTEAFMWGYERPNETAGIQSLPARQQFALKVYNELDFDGSYNPTNPIDPNEKTDNDLIHLWLSGALNGW